MADITEDEIRSIVESVLPIGTGDGQITTDHLHKLNRTHSTRDVASNEMDAVTIEFKHETKPDFDEAVTSTIHNAETVQELEDAIRSALPDDYNLINRNLEQYHRILFEVRAPLTGDADWLKY